MSVDDIDSDMTMTMTMTLIATILILQPDRQVFYPVEPLCVEKLPWFPYTLRLSRRSLVPVWGCGRHVPFGLTQVLAKSGIIR